MIHACYDRHCHWYWYSLQACIQWSCSVQYIPHRGACLHQSGSVNTADHVHKKSRAPSVSLLIRIATAWWSWHVFRVATAWLLEHGYNPYCIILTVMMHALTARSIACIYPIIVIYDSVWSIQACWSMTCLLYTGHAVCTYQDHYLSLLSYASCIRARGTCS